MMPTSEGSIFTHKGRETVSAKSIPPSSLWGTVFYACSADNNTVKFPVVIVNQYV